MTVPFDAATRGNLATRSALARGLDTLGGESSWWTTFALGAGVLLLQMAPIEWTANEINYIDLALRFVAPERFDAHSAVFDHSSGRFVSFGLLGMLAEIAGRNAAMVVGRVATILAYAAALATLARAWRLSAAEMTLALVVFLLIDQSYFAGEWLFFSVEAKTLAYPCAIAAVAWASRGGGGRAIAAAALATYMHFLVGGFWAAAVLLLLAIRGAPLARVARLGLVYGVVVAPLIAVLVYERLIVAELGIARLNEIYAVFRAPHHVAPFVSVGQFRRWIPGIGELTATGLLLGLAWATRDALRPITAWLLALHLYLALCFVLAFLDRGAHSLAPLYIFRPNSLILLFTLLILISWLRAALPQQAGGLVVATLALAALLAYIPQTFVPIALHLARAQPIPATPGLEAAAAEAMVEWLRGNTAPDAVVVVEPTGLTDGSTAWIAFERRTERPTLVNFKFVPTAPQDLARWHQLVRWREAMFAGACERLEEQAVDYLVVVQPATLERMVTCGRLAWRRDEFAVVAVGGAPAAGRAP